MSTSLILLQIGTGMLNYVFLGAMLLIFWLFFIRPQAKKQREQRTFMEGLKVEDEVVTSGGVLGKIYKIESDIITLEVSNKTYIRVTKNVISKEMTEWLKTSTEKLIIK
ncbi:MAG: preprotein translocase subunit YajC [Saprospiraceae bacterium]|nr:preprotein translocase subunit YajC [Saprospiraceae bacterium]MDZ4705788.1 preprotein translocase subunit YajC [Saprospiraceae bacterium]